MNETKKYIGTYHYGGKIQGITLKATDELDAKRRIKAIRRNNLRFQGEATKRVDTRKHTLADFVWFGRMIEKIWTVHQKVTLEHQMSNCSPKFSFSMSEKTADRFMAISTAYPDLIPLNLLNIPIVIRYSVPEDCVAVWY